jgi:hypothetical protein
MGNPKSISMCDSGPSALRKPGVLAPAELGAEKEKNAGKAALEGM